MKTCSLCKKDFEEIIRGFCRKCYSHLKYKGEIKILNENKDSNMSLSEIQNDLIIGSMLGDGCLTKNKTSKFPILKIERAIKDLEYLKYEFNILSNMCRSGVKTYFSKELLKNGEKRESCYFITRSYSILDDFMKKWYPEGKKIVPQDLKLNSYIISIWLADDGWIGIHHKKQNLLRTVFATNGFSILECEMLANLLSNKYNEKFKVLKTSTHSNQAVIACGHYATMIMYEDIKNAFPQSMQRKFKDLYLANDARNLIKNEITQSTSYFLDEREC